MALQRMMMGIWPAKSFFYLEEKLVLPVAFPCLSLSVETLPLESIVAFACGFSHTWEKEEEEDPTFDSSSFPPPSSLQLVGRP